MTLDAVVFPYKTLTHGCKDYLYSLVETVARSEESWSNNNYTFQTTATQEEDLYGVINKNFDSHSPSVVQTGRDSNSSTETSNLPSDFVVEGTAAARISRRSKRRRTVIAKNEEEIERQRMSHITVERNRRKQMNEYLAVLRSLMPPSYAKRGDQASIVGGAINFLKELEHNIQSMKGQKITKQQQSHENGSNNSSSSPFANFFMFPQYSTCPPQSHTCYPSNPNHSRGMADIEVTLVDSHANIKIMFKKQHGHVMKMVIGIQNLGLNILHLNVSTLDHLLLVSLSVKVEEGCELNTVEEIAAAVNQLSLIIQTEAIL